jgi:hypothetical protein
MSELVNDTESIYSPEAGEPCWPFWGLLETATAPSLFHISSVQPGIRFKELPPDFFARFESISRQALRMLKRRNISELSAAATEIRAEIARAVVEHMDIPIYDLITRPCKDGGDQLNPGHDDCSPTEHEISNLLEGWAKKWDDPSGLPTRDGLSDLDALRWFGTHYRSEQIWYGLIDPVESEAYAVLALMNICAAVHATQPTWGGSSPNPTEPTVWQLQFVGLATINAMAAIAHAENLELEQKIRNDIAHKQSELVAEALSRRTSERAVNAANKRHAPGNNARDWVCQEWALNRDSYSGNKSEFSRIYAARVKHEFKDSKGEQLSVTEKTIREVWLKNTPAAGK